MFQVWAGTDACEPVTWQECELVAKKVKFIVPEMNCKEKQELWYHQPEQVGVYPAMYLEFLFGQSTRMA